MTSVSAIASAVGCYGSRVRHPAGLGVPTPAALSLNIALAATGVLLWGMDGLSVLAGGGGVLYPTRRTWGADKGR